MTDAEPPIRRAATRSPSRPTFARERLGLVYACRSAVWVMLVLALAQGPTVYADALPDPSLTPQVPHDVRISRQQYIERVLQPLLDQQNGVEVRRAAAAAVLDLADPLATQLLVGALAERELPHVALDVAHALALHAAKPPAQLARPLLEKIDSPEPLDPAVRSQLVTALARFQAEDLVPQLNQIAGDRRRPLHARAGAVQVLGQFRNQAAAQALVNLLQPEQPKPLQDQAISALMQLTGLDHLQYNREQWQQWWSQARDMDTLGWQNHLLENFAQRDGRHQRQHEQLIQRLVETKRNLFRATPAEQRPAVLAVMLRDPLVQLRQAAVTIAVQRMVDGLPFDDGLRQALRDSLDDESAQVRQRATLLLRDLADEPAAQRVAGRLANGLESDHNVLRAALLMLDRMPQPVALDATVELLRHENLWSEAAATVAAMHQAGLLDEQQTGHALRTVRNKVDELGPTAQALRLLAQIGNERDWQRITTFLDNSDGPIRRAAARAISESDRPLADLAQRADDPIIQPELFAAAQRRGRLPTTLHALVDLHTAKPPADTAAWQRAVVAMAGRVSPAEVLAAVEKLVGADEPASDVARQMLSAAIDAQPQPDNHRYEQQLALLLQARALLRLAVQDHAGAAADFDRSAMLAPQSPDVFLKRIRAHLLLGNLDQAITLASQPPTNLPQTLTSQNNHPLLELFLGAAEHHAKQEQLAHVQQLLPHLYLLAGDQPDAQVQRRIDALKRKADEAEAMDEPGPDEPAATSEAGTGSERPS